LTEKFFLPCQILETRSYNAAVKAGNFRPIEARDAIVICSYQFARNKAADVANTPWDLVVMDEAHRLRNVYKPSNVIANTLKAALAGKHKLLLTATPLQKRGNGVASKLLTIEVAVREWGGFGGLDEALRRAGWPSLVRDMKAVKGWRP
jgi:superfamily II DNA or RNA helicase